VKPGDLVQYVDPDVEQEVGMVINVYEPFDLPNSRELVDILWAEGDMIVHDTYEFEVISEAR